MSQSLNLSISGIYTSQSDFQGIPQGALDVGDNIEIRYKNVAEPRRGFDSILNSAVATHTWKRLINFYLNGSDSIFGLRDDGNLYYYDGVTPWAAVPGDYSSSILAPDSINAKPRFIKAGQNLYLTSSAGIRSLSSGSGAGTVRAGVPKALNLQAVTNGDSSGFFTNNVVLATTGTTSSGSANLTKLASTTGIAVGQYVSGTDIPAGAKVQSITPSATIIIETGDTTAGSTSVTNVTSITGLVAGVLVSGPGIPAGATVASASGTTVVLSVAAFETATGSTLTFASSVVVTMDQNATANHTSESITFYSGSQVAYQMVFGRVETDVNGNNITRLGSPGGVAVANNILGTTTNVTVTGTIPKNADTEITFVQLYRSFQTAGISVSPLSQYKLVYQANLTGTDFTNRVITITDSTPDSLMGIPLYTGTDQEGILQANWPPPMAWDMAKFRDFSLFGNITQPSTLQVTVNSVGPSNGVQMGDTITIAGTSLGVSFSRVYTGASSETQSSGNFKIVTSGTPSQNITDTVNSLIRVINYDENCPVHAILLSGATDLPGKFLLEADNPEAVNFTVTASAHTSAYNPALSGASSQLNVVSNGILVSKSGQLESVPTTNLLYAGDSSSPILRIIPMRDYVIVLKTDGIYKIIGTSPSGLTSNPFDLTTKIIGAETAVSLNSGVWMLSNQGVVSISDGGVEAKSIPIDDQLNTIIGSYLSNLVDVGFAVGYESDRKYILCLPKTTNPYAETEFGFNYVTDAWTTWSRNLYSAFIHSNNNKMYISRADTTDNSISVERKANNYTDFVDEPLATTIVSVSGSVVTLTSVDGISAGDVLFQSSSLFSPILSVDLINLTVTVQFPLNFTAGSASVLKAFLCTITWKQCFGDNPAFLRQFNEGVVLFKNTRFNVITASFVTDFSLNQAPVPLEGTGNGLWGLFGWGNLPWGGVNLPSNIRFYIPQEKQLCSYLQPTLKIQQGYSDFKLQGMALNYENISIEVGL